MKTIRDLMTPDPSTIQVEGSVLDAWYQMDQGSFRHLPVLEGDELVGIVSQRDLLRSSGFGSEDPIDQVTRMSEASVRDVMAGSPDTAEADEPISEAANRMLENQYGCLPVVEGTRVIGILTSADFIRALAEQ